MSIVLVMPSSHLILWCPLLFCPQSFPESGTFQMSKLFASDDQNTGTSASVLVILASIQGWFPLGLTGLISLLSKGLSRVFHLHISKASILVFHFLYWQALTMKHDTGKTIALTIQTFARRVTSLIFNTPSSFFFYSFPTKKQTSSDFMAAVIIWSDF